MNRRAAFFFAALFCAPSWAATYFVRPDGSNANAGTANTSAGAWQTIAHAADQTAPGDVVRVQAGTYDEAVTETTDGTPTSPITYVADGSVTITRELTLESSDYVRVIGFNFDGHLDIRYMLILHDLVGAELWGNTFRGYYDTGVSTRWISDENPHTTSSGCIFVGNKFYGSHGDNHDYNHFSTWGDDNLFSHNEMNQAGVDFINFYGNRNRFVNNYGWGPQENTELHIDFLQTGANCCGRVGGTDYTLLEANFYIGGRGSDQHISNLETAVDYSGNFLSRRNVFHYSGGGGGYDYHHFYIVNDTWSDMQVTDHGTNICIYLARGGDQRVYNSIFTECWGSEVQSPYIMDVSPSGFMHDFNLAWDWQGGASMDWRGPLATETHHVVADPLYVTHVVDHVTHDGDDFRLQSGSPAIDAGGALTSVSSGNATGTTFDVIDAGFFRGFNPALGQYDGNLAAGDNISVGTDQLTISAISGNTITVTTSFTWANGDAVSLGWDPTPDIGAYPGDHVPLTAALSMKSGNEYSVVPNGDTRFVVFFVDGIPRVVDRTAPYSATIPEGIVTARAYAAYAARTLWADAIPGACADDFDCDEDPDATDPDDDNDGSLDGADCAPMNPARHPAAVEIADDAVDQNCDGHELCFVDADGDGVRPNETDTVTSADMDCTDTGEAGRAALTTDCNDGDGAIHPGAAESCQNEADDNCDGSANEGCPCTTGESRGCYSGPDGTEGVGPCTSGTQTCSASVWEICDGAILPVPEVCTDSIDNDCDGHADADDDACPDDVKPPGGDAPPEGCTCKSASPDPIAWSLSMLAVMWGLATRSTGRGRRRSLGCASRPTPAPTR